MLIVLLTGDHGTGPVMLLVGVDRHQLQLEHEMTQHGEFSRDLEAGVLMLVLLLPLLLQVLYLDVVCL